MGKDREGVENKSPCDVRIVCLRLHGVRECMVQRLHTPREYCLLPFVMLQLLHFNSIVLRVTNKFVGVSTMAYRTQHSCAYCGINKIVATAKMPQQWQS
jgi:hypothetical protein